MPPPDARSRAAAAVLLVRGDGADPSILLVERAPELRFFGGYLALPGGVRAADDGADLAGDDARPLWSCAVRELFEETGILLDPGLRAAAADRLDALRRRLVDGSEPSPWPTLLGAATDGAELRPLCRIETPPFAPVRYDTVFFLARLPDGAEPTIWPGELVGGRFWRPADALAAWSRGEVEIVPPVLILLDLLRDGDLDTFAVRAAHVAAEYRRGKLHRVRFSPGMILASLRTPTLPPATTTNCLVVGTDRLFVVDPATPYADEQERLFELLDELRAEGRELAGILLTHHHADHVGATHATSHRYGLTVRAHALTLERLAPGFRAGMPFEDGERIELGLAPDGSTGWQLEAIFTPGHDRGHVSFRETRYDAVIAGDMISTVSTIVIDPPEGHLATYLRSLERLLDTPMRTLYPAHGPAVRNGHRVVQQYLAHRAERERALVDALEQGPASTGQLVASVYRDVDPALWPLAERSLIAGLDKLAEEGRAVANGDTWQLVR